MDWIGLGINVLAIFIGLAIYIGLCRSSWGQKHANYQYAIMLLAMLLAILLAGLLRSLLT